MSAVKDYAKEYIEIGQDEMPVSVALLVLKYRYDVDIVVALYNYACVHQDDYMVRQANAAYSRNRKRNPEELTLQSRQPSRPSLSMCGSLMPLWPCYTS